MLENALQGINAHANHDVYPEARTLFCEVIACMSRRRARGPTFRINQNLGQLMLNLHDTQMESGVLRFPMAYCLALNDARKDAYLEAGGIA